MKTAFLLRFQEACLASDPPDIPSGTQTLTRMEAEQPDTDYDRSNYYTLRIPPQASDPTRTCVRAETPDDSYGESGMTVLPQLNSATTPTMTMTAVQAEATDADYGQNSMRVIPKCC
jgi:hypothetical protein